MFMSKLLSIRPLGLFMSGTYRFKGATQCSDCFAVPADLSDNHLLTLQALGYGTLHKIFLN